MKYTYVIPAVAKEDVIAAVQAEAYELISGKELRTQKRTDIKKIRACFYLKTDISPEELTAQLPEEVRKIPYLTITKEELNENTAQEIGKEAAFAVLI